MTFRRSRRPTCVLAAAVAGMLSLAALQGTSSAAPSSSTASGQPSAAAAASTPRFFGAWVEPGSGQTRTQALKALETSLGATLPLVTDYLAWDETFPSAFDKSVAARGGHLLLFVKLKRK